MTVSMKYVVAMVDDSIAIGPFATEHEARAYHDTDLDRDKMHVLAVRAPEPGWKKMALTNWPNGVARNNRASK